MSVKIESWVADRSASDHYDASLYPHPLEPAAWEKVASFVECRLESPASHARDELDSLLQMATPAVLAWLRRKASLADGTRLGFPHVAPVSVTESIRALVTNRGSWKIKSGRKSRDGWSILHVGLLRDLACASFVTIGHRTHVSSVEAGRLNELHRRLMSEDRDYGGIAAKAAQEILEGAFSAH